MVWAAFCFSAEINLMQHATMPCEGPADLQLPQGLGLLNGIFELVKYRLGGHAASFRLAATRHLVEQKRAVDRWGVKASPQHSHVTLSGGASTDAFPSDPPRYAGGTEEAASVSYATTRWAFCGPKYGAHFTRWIGASPSVVVVPAVAWNDR